MNLKELFLLGWQRFKRNWKGLLPLVFVWLGIDIFYFFTGSTVGLSSVYGLIIVFFQLKAYESYKREVEEQPVDDKRKYQSLVWVWIISDLMLLGLFLLLIIPGVIYFVYWSLAYFVILDKGITGKKALDYSKNLIKGKWFKTLVLLVLLNAVPLLMAFPFAIIGAVIGGDLLSTLLVSVVLITGSSYSAFVLLEFYLKLENK